MTATRTLTDADLDALAARLAPLVAEQLQTDLATSVGKRILNLLFSGSVLAAVGLSAMHFLGVHVK